MNKLMKVNNLKKFLPSLAVMVVATTGGLAAKERNEPLNEAGKVLEARYAATLEGLRAEIAKDLPTISAQEKTEFDQAGEAVKTAAAEATAAQQNLNKVNSAKGLVDHAKGKWIGGAEKGIAAAEAALEKATTDAEREAASTDLAKWRANKDEGLQALKERQQAYELARIEEPAWKLAHEAAQTALTQAQSHQRNAANALLADLAPVMGSDQLDAKLAKCVVMTVATPGGLAGFAQQGSDQAALVEKLLADAPLMKEMLAAGGAKFGEYGRAMEIFTAIQKTAPKANEGTLQRLALATALEHARPIARSNPKDQTTAPATIDPVQRYLHYEKAFLNGELDAAFKGFGVWEYRMVVNCDAPDQILAWGREMLRNYRPDHIHSTDYGWRYVASVRTEVPYGSQNVKDDLPSLHNYQNIIMNGGVCGRRAFFGRFILRSFGIPTWGVTQHKHAALSHWTPAGWVVNLGAGFQASWWDKDEVSLSGTQFLLETQAREHALEYPRVLRAQWVSRILGEPAYNDRRNISGGVWSSIAHFYSVMLSEKAVSLGPLGQELAEANEKEQLVVSAAVSAADQKVAVQQGGIITIPAVAHGKSSGKASAMKSDSGGMQLHCLGGFNAPYEMEVPQAGNYTLTARVATVQTGQIFLFTVNDSKQPIETAVPYTLGLWQQTEPVEVSLIKGQNTLHFDLKPGSRGVTIKEFTLTPVTS